MISHPGPSTNDTAISIAQSSLAVLHDLHTRLSPSQTPLVVARPIRWIITPSSIDTAPLLDPLSNPSSTTYRSSKTPGIGTYATSWDLLLILPDAQPLPITILEKHVRASYTLTTGIPTAVHANFPQRNKDLIRPAHAPPPLTDALDRPLTTPTAQNLELTHELRDWYNSYWRHQGAKGRGPVSMLNLLAFAVPREKAHESYASYGKAFAESIGRRRGGTAKIVGKVVPSPIPHSSRTSSDVTLTDQKTAGNATSERGETLGGEWEEIALAHYPSFEHFCDMAASQDYQEVNRKYRLPSLRDTCILMCSEIEEGVTQWRRGGTPQEEVGERADGIVGRSAKM